MTLIDSKIAAGMLGTSEQYVRKLARTKKLQGRRIGWTWVFDVQDVLRYNREQRTTGRPRLANPSRETLWRRQSRERANAKTEPSDETK